jgi:conjugative transposon TraJ protein
MVNVAELTGIGSGLAALGALLYISYRVWGHLARTESIDFFPLLRPFALGLVLALYPSFIGLLNGILQPTVTGTAALVDDANGAITTLLQEKQTALQQSTGWQAYVGTDGSGNPKWEQYSAQSDSGAFSGISDELKFELSKSSFSFSSMLQQALSQILEIVYEAAALCINTLRSFELLLLAILGPLAIGLSAFDGFKQVFTAWLGRYINVFLWLPVCNLYGSFCAQIQAQMIRIDLQQIQGTGQTAFGPTSTGYIIFLIIAIFGYFCIPSITGHIINVFPGGGGTLLGKTTNTAAAAVGTAVRAAGKI